MLTRFQHWRTVSHMQIGTFINIFTLTWFNFFNWSDFISGIVFSLTYITLSTKAPVVWSNTIIHVYILKYYFRTLWTLTAIFLNLYYCCVLYTHWFFPLYVPHFLYTVNLPDSQMFEPFDHIKHFMRFHSKMGSNVVCSLKNTHVYVP